MRAAEKQVYLEAVDAVLAPIGFRRPKRSQEWSRTDGNDRVWAHLNFGIAMIGLSVGVEYRDVRESWPNLPSGRFTASEFPQDEWAAGDPPGRLADYVHGVVQSRVDGLRDRDAVIDRLRSSDAGAWPTICYGDRIRLLPVLLASRSRQEEALEFCQSVVEESLTRDQFRPCFTEFLEAFEAALAN